MLYNISFDSITQSRKITCLYLNFYLIRLNRNIILKNIIIYAALINIIINIVFFGGGFMCNYTIRGPRQKPLGVSRRSQLH